jgi:hypothetical protein
MSPQFGLSAWFLGCLRCAADSMPPSFYVNNRRDGSRLLSSALVITGAGFVRIDHPVGRVVAVIGSVVSLYWWFQYRKLEH